MFNHLPHDTLLEILSHLNAQDLARTAQVNKQSYQLTRHHRLWKQAIITLGIKPTLLQALTVMVEQNQQKVDFRFLYLKLKPFLRRISHTFITLFDLVVLCDNTSLLISYQKTKKFKFNLKLLHRAALMGSLSLIKMLEVQYGLQPDSITFGNAIKSSNLSLIQYLLDKQTNNNREKSDCREEKIIPWEVEKKHSIAQIARECFYDLSTLRYLETWFQPYLKSAIECLAEQGVGAECVYYAKEKHLSLNSTTLSCFFRGGNLNAIEAILKEYHIKPHATHLINAIESNRLNVVEYLETQGFNLEGDQYITGDQYKEKAVTIALFRNNLSLLQHLIEHYAIHSKILNRAIIAMMTLDKDINAEIMYYIGAKLQKHQSFFKIRHS